MSADERFLAFAERQHAVVSVSQAKACGLSREALRHRVAKGALERATPRVLRLAGSPRTIEQALMIEVLDHGRVWLARTTSLAMWGLPGFAERPVQLVGKRDVHPRRTSVAKLHSSRDLLPTHLAEVRCIPTTTPIRAIFDIAGTEHPKKVERALDNAWARRLVTYPLLHRTLDELADRGRDGIALMRELAAARPRSYRPPESNAEARLNDLLESRGHKRLRPQRDVGGEEAWVGRSDFGDDDLPNFLVEVQSELFHGSLLDRQRDAARLKALRDSGFVVVEIWESTIWRCPDDAVAAVVAGRRRARRRSVA